MGWLRCSRASSASDPLASRKPVNSFKQSDTALFQPHTPTQRHVRPQPGIQAAHPDRLLRSLLRAPVPHIPTRPCRDIPPVRPLLSYEQVIPTHLTLPEPTSTHPVLLHQILLRRRTALRTRPAEQGRRMSATSHPCILRMGHQDEAKDTAPDLTGFQNLSGLIHNRIHILPCAICAHPPFVLRHSYFVLRLTGHPGSTTSRLPTSLA